jgi:hypothetical protein
MVEKRSFIFKRFLPSWAVALRFLGDWWYPEMRWGLISGFTFVGAR